MYCQCRDEDDLLVISADAFCLRDDLRARPLESRSCGIECAATYSWDTRDWSPCDKVCALGKQTRTVNCIKETTTSVRQSTSDSECENAGIGPKPVAERDCDFPCQYITGEWGDCSVSCGGGQETRSVTCQRTEVDGSTRTVQLRDCEEDVSLGSKPRDTRQCNVDMCVVGPIVGTCRHVLAHGLVC